MGPITVRCSLPQRHNGQFLAHSNFSLECEHRRVDGGHYRRIHQGTASGLGRKPGDRRLCRICKARSTRVCAHSSGRRGLHSASNCSKPVAHYTVPTLYLHNKVATASVTKSKCVICREQFYSLNLFHRLNPPKSNGGHFQQ